MSTTNLQKIGKVINIFAIPFPRLVSKFILFKFSRPLAKKGFENRQQNYLRFDSNIDYHKIEGTKIACYHWPGEGPKILLCHGWESNSSRWEPLIKLLQSHHFDIYAFDAPAHGWSEGKSVTPVEFIAVINQMNQIHSFDYIIGHSYGGFNALFFASTHSNSLKKIIALAPTNSVKDVVLGMQARMGFSDRVIRYFNKAFQVKFKAAPDDFRSDQFTKSIDSIGMIIHDTDDLVLPLEGSQSIHQSWTGSKLLTTTGLGHRLRSKAVYQAIIEFLK